MHLNLWLQTTRAASFDYMPVNTFLLFTGQAFHIPMFNVLQTWGPDMLSLVDQFLRYS
jgi:hypothetical protein